MYDIVLAILQFLEVTSIILHFPHFCDVLLELILVREELLEDLADGVNTEILHLNIKNPIDYLRKVAGSNLILLRLAIPGTFL